MKLSIVATLYQSSKYVFEFYQRASKVAVELVGDDYEIILVNDGSPDNSLELAMSLVDEDSHVVVVDLSRNFGHHKAMMTGLFHAKGDRVFLIDSDLEEEPEWLEMFSSQMEQKSCDVVYGVQAQRKGGWFERWSGQLFYYLFRWLTGFNFPANVVTARLMSRRYVSALLMHKEREVFIAGLWYITGFDQSPCIIKKHHASATTYTLQRKLTLLINSVTSFSNAPLVAIFYVGLLIFLLSLLHIGFLLVNWLFWGRPISGWTSVMASIWFLSGMMISFVGVIGIYLSKIFSEIKSRPYTIVRQVYSKKK